MEKLKKLSYNECIELLMKDNVKLYVDTLNYTYHIYTYNNNGIPYDIGFIAYKQFYKLKENKNITLISHSMTSEIYIFNFCIYNR